MASKRSSMRQPAPRSTSLPSSSSRRTLPIKRADAEPLTRKDIQYDLLQAIFSDPNAVFTDQSLEGARARVANKLTFCELYSLAIIASPRCSKVLREKMAETPEFAIDFAKIALLANVGRINTTMAFFPEMRTVLRSYHPIPSLQKTEANLQDAPRIKNCLKACLLPGEQSNPPSTPADIFAKAKNGVVPTTSIVNLIFVLSNHSVSVSKMHFEPPFGFSDLFLPVNASSSSRARAFLWLMFHYLESPSAHNPFSDDFSNNHPGKVPKMVILNHRQRSLENMDTKDELDFGRRMAHYRSQFLQKQIADEKRDKANRGSHDIMKARFKVSTPSTPTCQSSRPGLKAQGEPVDGKENFCTPCGNTHQRSHIALQSKRTWSGSCLRAERTMVEHAWHMAVTTDPLLASDEEAGDEHVKIDYQRRLHILNTQFRRRAGALIPEHERRGKLTANVAMEERLTMLQKSDWDICMDTEMF